MSELNGQFEGALIDCLRALDGGADLDGWLARHPRYASALREHLKVRARLLAIEVPDPAAYEFERGRQALLARLQERRSVPGMLAALRGRVSDSKRRSPFAHVFSASSPLARCAAAAAFLALLGGGAIGASAAAGFQPAREVLSALRIPGVADNGGDGSAENGAVPPKQEDGGPGSLVADPPRKRDATKEADQAEKSTPTPSGELNPTPHGPAVEPTKPPAEPRTIVEPKPTEHREPSSNIRPTERRENEGPARTNTPRPTKTPTPTKEPEDDEPPKPTKTPEDNSGPGSNNSGPG